MDDRLRRSMPLFSMGIVQNLTGLTARQIRYYEENALIEPERTEGNRRVFSFNDVEKLLDIKSLLDEGVNLAGIKHVLSSKPVEANQPLNVVKQKKSDLSDADLMKYLKSELINAGKFGDQAAIQGEFSRFFNQK
ncbi:MerR family transcriptional regulator [Terrilactibacillus laevilacticus]|uniref:MerR family transcriptional regulator n=1 Tax=Terrilactibacillus laevilacticus TaxID=1380157 RepID=A0ABW5PPM4_9BACI|nr:MerR family transcriptional regulator [Terrilactibacillus laevilacticus]